MYDVTGSDIDYNYEEYNVTFLAGYTRVSFDVMIINDDDLTNEYELVNISISSISNGHTSIGDPGVATVIITRTTGEYCTNLFTIDSSFFIVKIFLKNENFLHEIFLH